MRLSLGTDIVNVGNKRYELHCEFEYRKESQMLHTSLVSPKTSIT